MTERDMAGGGGADMADVLVIGAGPVGQTTALLLARWGLRPLIVDVAAGRSGLGSKAICQQRDVLDIWASVGAGGIAEEGVTWSTARTFYRDADLFRVDLADPGASPLPAFVNISQAATERHLDDTLHRTGIDIHWGHEVVELTQESGGVTAHCRTATGRPTIRAQWAVLAAGARAANLRAGVGLDFHGRSFDDAFLICDIRAELPGWEAERRFYFDPPWNPGRQVLIHPCPGGTYRIDWQVDPTYELAAEQASGALDARIRQVIGAVPYELAWSSVYRFHSRCVPRMRAGRVLLAGDVAHLMAPFGARGLNSGVADAENAAWKLAYTLRGWAGPELIDSYHSERHAAAAENLAVTGRTMDFLVPHTDEQCRRRVAVLQAAVGDPAAREQVDSGRLYEPFWYTDSPLTTPHPDRPLRAPLTHGRGPGVVAPGVVVPDAPVRVSRPAQAPRPAQAVRRPAAAPSRPTRLRELTRHGLLLLCGSGTDPGDAVAAVSAAVPPGVRVDAFRIDSIDVTGALQQSLDLAGEEIGVIRPDAHLAGFSRTPAQAAAIARRALGWS